MTTRARTYFTARCTSCGKLVLRAKGNPYFVTQGHAEEALRAHALRMHAVIGSEKVVVEKTVSYKVAKA